MKTTTLTPLGRPTHAVNFAKILPLFQPAASNLVRGARALTPTRLVATAPARAEVQLFRGPLGTVAPLASMETPTMSVERTQGTISRLGRTADLQALGTANLQLPFGSPRFVNAATLKRMLNASRSDVLLKRSGNTWDVCENSMRVDLMDDSVEFRLGAVQIFS